MAGHRAKEKQVAENNSIKLHVGGLSFKQYKKLALIAAVTKKPQTGSWLRKNNKPIVFLILYLLALYFIINLPSFVNMFTHDRNLKFLIYYVLLGFFIGIIFCVVCFKIKIHCYLKNYYHHSSLTNNGFELALDTDVYKVEDGDKYSINNYENIVQRFFYADEIWLLIYENKTFIWVYDADLVRTGQADEARKRLGLKLS